VVRAYNAHATFLKRSDNMTKDEFDELALKCYPDIFGENGECKQCRNITSLDIQSAEQLVLANISPSLSCCRPCAPNIEKRIKKAIVYAVLVDRMYNPEKEGRTVARMVNDYVYAEGLVHFG